MNIPYSFLRKFFFWILFIAFIIIAPVSVLYSLGYKFDIETKRFVKTGAIYVSTIPAGAKIYLDGELLKTFSPHAIRGLLPDKYAIVLQKERFYPYKISLEVKASEVEKLDITLVPRVEVQEELKSDFEIYNFFVIKSLLAQQMVAFTDKGIYLIDNNLNVKQEISPDNFNRGMARSLDGLKENNGRVIFWNTKTIWLLDSASAGAGKASSPEVIYKADNIIKDVYFGLKDRYLIILDGLKIVASDISNSKMHYIIFTLRNRYGKIFYDSQSDVLYIEDNKPDTGKASLLKVDLTDVIHD